MRFSPEQYSIPAKFPALTVTAHAARPMPPVNTAHERLWKNAAGCDSKFRL